MHALRSIKLWIVIHRWSSLACTLVLLMLCVTGLPLIFSDEIAAATGRTAVAPDLPAGTPPAELEALVAAVSKGLPAWRPKYLIWKPDDPNVVLVEMGSPDAKPDEDRSDLIAAVDERTAAVLKGARGQAAVMTFIRRLHTNLHAGDWGTLAIGIMGGLFIVALISGAVLYTPYMRRLRFGEVRFERPRRTGWLDLHNLLSIATIGWSLVVGVTGVIHVFGDPVFDRWRSNELAALLAPYKDKPLPQNLATLDQVMAQTRDALPDWTPWVIAYPGTRFSSPHHFTVWMRGNEPLTSKLLRPVLIDAESASVTAAPEMPWPITVLRLAKPLHFGDYGGLPLKILWGLFDLVTIFVLVSGVYLWRSRRRALMAPARHIEVPSAAS